MRILSLIPARGGSKGIPGKNLKICGGLPLIAHSIKRSLACELIDRTVVTTDDPEIAGVAREFGAEVPFTRPAELAVDTSSTESAVEHALDTLEKDEGYLPDAVMLLQPTSPLRTAGDLTGAIELMEAEQADSLLSVFENSHFLWSGRTKEPINYRYLERPRRQDKEWEFIENGSIYLTRVGTFRKHRNRLGGKIAMYVMPGWRSSEIDEPGDLDLIDHYMPRLAAALSRESGLEAGQIKMLVLDFDGIFTDGAVYLDEAGNESIRCSRLDGKGLQLLQERGISVAVISAEGSRTIEHRCSKLGIEQVHTGIRDKLSVYERIKTENGLADDQICFCGDDVQDLELIKIAGLGCCPANAMPVIKRYSDIVFDRCGGHGFIRQVCEMLIGDIR